MRLKPSHIIVAAITGFAGAALGAGTVSALTPGEATVAAQPQLVTRGAILMLGAHPRIYTNGAHTSMGSARLVLTAGLGRSRCYADIYFDHNPGERILNISATPDDKMVWQGISVGTAGGNGKVSLRLYQASGSNGKRKAICANNSTINPSSNVWLMTTVVGTAAPVADVQPTTPKRSTERSTPESASAAPTPSPKEAAAPTPSANEEEVEPDPDATDTPAAP